MSRGPRFEARRWFSRFIRELRNRELAAPETEEFISRDSADARNSCARQCLGRRVTLGHLVLTTMDATKAGRSVAHRPLAPLVR